MPRPGQFLVLLLVGILVYLTGALAGKSCCRVKGCNIPSNCECPLKAELCRDVSKGILSMGKRTSYEENVYKKFDQNNDRQHELRKNQIWNTIMQMMHREEQEPEQKDWKTRSLWKPEEFTADLYEQEPNFYTD